MEKMTAFPINFLPILIFLIVITDQNTFGCIPEEREALLKFKASFYDPWNKLSAWNDEDCCNWKGIKCDDVSGHVSILDVSTSPALGHEFFGCQLQSPTLDPSLSELKYVTYLDLSGNDFQLSPIPAFLGSMNHLERLSLAGSNFSGPIPSSFGNLSTLGELILGGNKQLSGEIPTSLGMLSNLETLHLSYTSLNGTLSEAHFSNVSKLKNLYTSYSLLEFRLGFDWVPPFQLEVLEMESCDIGGSFPHWLRTQKELTRLDLTNCSISGTMPEWLKNYVNLTTLYLSGNNISGTIPEVLPSRIGNLDISHNMISGPLPSNIGQMLPLSGSLVLSQNSINGTIPDSLCEMEILRTVDLSKNQLSGKFPSCWGKLEKLSVLRLSSNKLSGVVPESIGSARSLEWLHLNNNSFTGKLPSTLKNCIGLNVMDVGENMFSETLPDWIGEYLLDLKILRLRNNNFLGEIPRQFCRLSQIQIMDLSNNELRGSIPHCFGNFSGMVKKEPKEEGYASPFRFYSTWDDESLSMVLKGLELEYTKTLVYAFNLDLSNNNLVGEIPFELTNLSAVLGLNLSHNHLTGRIPEKIGSMMSLESLDISSNNLFGKIPNSLSDLSSLSHLNLSYNNFSGKIPTGPQLQTLDNPSIYDGNPQLCGAPLLKRCNEDETINMPNVEDHATEDKDDDGDKIWLYGIVISGFATGFWVVIGTLVFKTSWRHAYFRFLEERLGRWFGAL